MLTETPSHKAQEAAGQSGIAELCSLAAAGLAQMYDEEQKLFCRTYAQTEAGMARQGGSARYTLMSLLGLHRYELTGAKPPVTIAAVLDNMMEDTRWVGSAGDLGLLLWACAEILPRNLPEVYRRVRANDALARFRDGRLGFTMEVAWHLTGLVACYEAGHADLPGLREQLAAARRILVANCGAGGIYGHLNTRGSFAGYLRGSIGSFADQVYPTIAFARLARALNDLDALEMATRTASTMCALQGAFGEWSWLYSSRSARVINRYPVYSVHQHAMGPMMLFAAGDANRIDYSAAIGRSLAWISGNNELRRNFIEPSLALVWRSIYLQPGSRLIDTALRFLRMRTGAANAPLKVRFECRPYELGWLLYAFAGKKIS